VHEQSVRQHGIHAIDLVVVNLYPFEQTVTKPHASIHDAIENIDIGGPAMLRSAAKNHEFVTVVMDSGDYTEVAEQVRTNGNTTLELRRKLAARVFARTSAYDAIIAAHLIRVFGSSGSAAPVAAPVRRAPERTVSDLPATLTLNAPQVQALRYGENPHQQAALYGHFNDYFKQLHGKELSYNNILDLTSSAELIAEFLGGPPTLAILKHTNPCGVGQGSSLTEAWEKAYATDTKAPFGGIIAVNQTLDAACAQAIVEIFSEVIVAPDYEPAALQILQTKKNLRLLQMLQNPRSSMPWDIRSVGVDSFLMQERDQKELVQSDIKVVSRRPPSVAEFKAMMFGWRLVKHIKSNAILFAAPESTLGIGAGQMSRVDACRIAVWKAAEAGLSLKGSVVCSDAFFPFADGLIAAAEAGATAAIEPGGSVRDAEVIAAADQHGMALIFTGTRHFRH
jgi:phosphoribosylaminoimidazolecarboxamide formyltransferase / IMP cyclohydrolase